VGVDAAEEDSGAGAVEAVLDRFFDLGPAAKKRAPRAGNGVKAKHNYADPIVHARDQDLWSSGAEESRGGSPGHMKVLLMAAAFPP